MTDKPGKRTLTVRVPEETHRALLTYKLFTGATINDVVSKLIGDFLDGPGREAISRGIAGQQPRER